MDVAVIGGGSAGLVTAWLLDRHHRVTVFEREPICGGHVRTVGGNVASRNIPPELRLDAGVVLFERDNFPSFHALVARLGVPMRSVPGITTMTLGPRGTWLSPGAIQRLPWLLRLASWPRDLPLARERWRFLARTRSVRADTLYAHAMEHFLDDGVLSTWIRLLLMYAYSTDYERTPELPAALAVPMLRGHLCGGRWTAMNGGAWTYLGRILADLRGEVHTGVAVVGVARAGGHVVVHLDDGTERRFDRAVIATEPGEILPLLLDADETERRRFGAWRTYPVRTVLHRDDSPYLTRRLRTHTEFDLFRTRAAHGYNACLNGIAGLPDGPPWYGLAFHLEDELHEDDVLHVQEHRTPWYTVEALRPRPDVIRDQPYRGLCYAGAWLGNGLQEGAVRSALWVSHLLGGRGI